ncbi:OsmC family protein [Dokdonella sp.]|uniref:OsmC family protein n=1 Tax=Dokdonella sp. TaxID=2291710 RepID=UPI0035277C72
MSEHTAVIEWNRDSADFANDTYSRAHRWTFDGGAVVAASASPHVVPVPLADASAVDPEEAFVASLSSCHMLWFLSIARKRGFVVDCYRDAASGRLGKDVNGNLSMTVVTLRPEVQFGGDHQPDSAQLESLHHAAHKACFIANSVKTEVRCEPVFPA